MWWPSNSLLDWLDSSSTATGSLLFKNFYALCCYCHVNFFFHFHVLEPEIVIVMFLEICKTLSESSYVCTWKISEVINHTGFLQTAPLPLLGSTCIYFNIQNFCTQSWNLQTKFVDLNAGWRKLVPNFLLKNWNRWQKKREIHFLQFLLEQRFDDWLDYIVI